MCQYIPVGFDSLKLFAEENWVLSGPTARSNKADTKIIPSNT